MNDDPLERLVAGVENFDEEKVPRRLKYGEDLVKGDVVFYMARDANPEYEPPAQAYPNFLAILSRSEPEYIHHDAWATVLEVRTDGHQIVSLILVDEDGDQVGHVVHPLQTLLVRAQ